MVVDKKPCKTGLSVWPISYKKAIQGALHYTFKRQAHLQKTGTILKEMKKDKT